MENNDNITFDDIGLGYRNIVYRSNNGKGEIILYGYNKNGTPKVFIIPHTCHAHYEVKYETKLKSIFNTSLATKLFNTSYERYKWLDSLSDGIKVFEAFRPEVEFLHHQFGKDFMSDDFNIQPLRTHFIDCEIAIESEFPSPIDAKYPINIITIYDTHYKRYYSWVLGNVENSFKDKDNYIIFKFNSEEDLLLNFINWFKANYPDVLSGWNIKSFDIPYIIRRLENILGEKKALEISPIRKYRLKEGHDKNGRQTYEYVIDAISQMDLLLLYRDKFLISPALDGGYNLDNVAEHELNENKISYEGTMRDFYIRDFQKFFEYNIKDVELLVKLEDKLQLISLARRITSLGLCQLETIYNSLPYLIGSLSLFSRNNTNKIFPSYRNDDKHDRGSFEGAYVFPTKHGFYKNGVACIDLNSLYPNTIISLNCSPETKVGQLNKNIDDTYTIRSSTNSKTISKSALDKILDEKCILSKNNTLFLKHSYKKGIIAQWCIEFYKRRKFYQSKMKSLKRNINKQIDNNDKKTTDEIKLYNTIQMALKLSLNSIYGILGTPFSPIYDIDLAQSITLNGQFTNKMVSTFVKNTFIERYNIDKDLNPCIAGDTDSLFIDIQPLTLKYSKKFDIESKNLSKFTRTQFKELSKELDDFVENEINPYVANLINTECHTLEGHNIKYGREYIASEGMFFKKKHYLVHIIDDDGAAIDKFKYSGIAVKKTNLPPSMKPLLKHIYEKTCIEHWSYSEYQNYLNDIFDKFKKYDFEDIAFNQGYNTEKQITGFLKSEKGTQAAVRAGHCYNQLLDKFNIKSKYDQIIVGDIIRYVYVYDNNQFGVNVIGFKKQFPIEFKSLFKINYELMFEKLFIDTLDGYVEAMMFPKYEPSNQMDNNIFAL